MKWSRKSKSPQPNLRILIHSPRTDDDRHDQLTPDSVTSSPMSLGIHLNPKTTDISSSTWPKMKRSESNPCDVDVARIVRPQTATLERPRILDVALLRKIDMSLTRKGLLSISNLCIAPLDNVQASRDSKRNSTFNKETRHGGKTRKWNTPRKSITDKDRIKQVKNHYRRNGYRTDESWDEEENSVSESSVSVRRVSRTVPVSRSPSRGTQRAGDKGISPVNSISSNANSPRRTVVKTQEKAKRLSPASCTNSNSNSPSRGPLGKPRQRETRLSPVSSVGSAANSPSRESNVKNVSREKRVLPVGNNNVSEDNAEKPRRRTCKRPVVVKKDGKNVDEVFGGPKPRDEVPEPCRTCGRPEQPERFHSHPPPSSHRKTSAARRQHDNNNNNNNNNNEDTRPAVTKSSVRKPVPMKYRSGKSKRRESSVVGPGGEASAPNKVPSPDSLKRNSSDTKTSEVQNVDRKSPRAGTRGVFLVLDDKGSDKPIVRSGPRTVLCYLCGREFGTASYPLHEPHCLQRWERENSHLPTHLRRAAPEKPSNPLTVEQWNAFAWEASQAHLVPCDNCGRTFNPDRLEVHQRSCRPPAGQVARRSHQEQEDDGGSCGVVKGPPAVYCYICGKMFGTRSIAIHEPQCLEKWRLENAKLPPHQRRSEPVRPQTRLTTARTQAVPGPEHPSETPKDPKLAAAPHVMDCYLCGREFDTRVLNRHEDECIKHWRKWNNSLPIDQRQPEPQRPEFKFNKATGNMDYNETMEAIWQEHLKSLVPCSLGCGRTFNPDRVAVHERGCKGPKK
ncbi:uncharacterized protein LOC111873274 isoform X2 [Cryptotermes secundus]|uniref:uncharacterized protein LOC111873274 isoform X2 n=1 Tax=Cryptotermes secundus TaxID=105785 RepID=UPI000CD7D5E7|nr:uncharacterized protein LOC111873274 isoform X2 [Cryptotermes secundus]